MTPRTTLVFASALLGLCASGAQAQETELPPAPPPTGEVAVAFNRLRPAIVRIEVQETGADALSAVGSGFFAAPDGRIITNYHVISRLVNEPDRHRVRATTATDTSEVKVLAVDVVHDLAVLDPGTLKAGLQLSARPTLPEKGERLLAIGHPRDLGLSIVEGTYNGQVERMLTPRLHFTGPLNPGMSGGPAVTASGQLVGVNVATMGEELAFLVPADRVVALLARAPSEPPPTDSLLAGMARDVAAYAEMHLASVFATGSRQVNLGQFKAPTEPTPTYQCWGDSREFKDDGYRIVLHQCSTDESIFLSEELSASLMSFKHELVQGKQLSLIRLLTTAENTFNQTMAFDGNDEQTTRFRCDSRNVRSGKLTFRTEFCARRYRRLPGLYEAVLRATPFNGRGERLVTTLNMSGVPFKLVRQMVERFLLGIELNGAEAAAR